MLCSASRCGFQSLHRAVQIRPLRKGQNPCFCNKCCREFNIQGSVRVPATSILTTPMGLAKTSKMKAITPTEKKILELIADGFSTTDAAGLLNMSRFTVSSHRRSLLKKFDVKNSAQLVLKAVQCRIIDTNNGSKGFD